MYKSLVVGTDGSSTAGIALRAAIELAGALGATLHIVHAHKLVDAAFLGPEVAGVDFGSTNVAIRDDSVRICEAAVAEAKVAGVEAESHSATGDAAGALLDVAEEVDADLIVVGNRGMSGKRRFMLGSVPNKVSHHCPCDLLIIETQTA